MDLSPSSLKNENDYWNSFRDGNEAAFLFLYESYFTLLFTWGCKWTNGDAYRVKDVLHDFFIYLWEKKANLSENINLKNYLLTAFKRRLLHDIAVSHQSATDLHPDMGDVEAAQHEISEAEDFVSQFEIIKQAMNLLSPAQREVIELRYLHNMSIEEIAERKQTTHRTVYNLVHRALVTLRKEARKKNFLLLW